MDLLEALRPGGHLSKQRSEFLMPRLLVGLLTMSMLIGPSLAAREIAAASSWNPGVLHEVQSTFVLLARTAGDDFAPLRGARIPGHGFRATRRLFEACRVCFWPPSNQEIFQWSGDASGLLITYSSPAPRLSGSSVAAVAWIKRNFMALLPRDFVPDSCHGGSRGYTDSFSGTALRYIGPHDVVVEVAIDQDALDFDIEHLPGFRDLDYRNCNPTQQLAASAGARRLTNPAVSATQAGASANRSEGVADSSVLRLSCSQNREAPDRFTIDLYLGTVAMTDEQGETSTASITQATPSQVVWVFKDFFGDVKQFRLNRQALQLQVTGTGGLYYTQECSAS